LLMPLRVDIVGRRPGKQRAVRFAAGRELVRSTVPPSGGKSRIAVSGPRIATPSMVVALSPGASHRLSSLAGRVDGNMRPELRVEAAGEHINCKRSP
jgi:hypothetical protein